MIYPCIRVNYNLFFFVIRIFESGVFNFNLLPFSYISNINIVSQLMTISKMNEANNFKNLHLNTSILYCIHYYHLWVMKNHTAS